MGMLGWVGVVVAVLVAGIWILNVILSPQSSDPPRPSHYVFGGGPPDDDDFSGDGAYEFSNFQSDK